jgi:hypothetical protein
MSETPAQRIPTTRRQLDERCAIVLAGVERLGGLQGFPITDFAVVAETDVDLGEVRECLRGQLADGYVEVAPGERDGSVEVVALVGRDDDEGTPEVPQG